MGPLHLGGLGAAPDDGEDVTRLDQCGLDEVPVREEGCTVGLVGRRDPLRAVVEVIETAGGRALLQSAGQPSRHAPGLTAAVFA